MANEPHEPAWRAALEVANAVRRCGAKRKRDAEPCQAPAMKNGRCRVHGGRSTGPITVDGRARSRRANWKHGHYSAEAKAERSQARICLRELRHWLTLAGGV
jgi:hypothetical protein